MRTTKATWTMSMLAVVAVAAVFPACDGGSEDEILGAVGESCANTADCESKLECINQVCQQAGANCPGDSDCSGVECGPDPVCGESCGSCDSDEICQAGQCVESGSEDTYSPDVDPWTDPSSGLTWQVEPTGGTMNWSDAKAHCAGLSLGGGGWHLPTISELRTLIRGCPASITGGACGVTDACLDSSCMDDGGCFGCSHNGGPADGCYWPDEMQGPCTVYWSSSPVESHDGMAWPVGFDYGSIHGFCVPSATPVRCVR